MTDLVPQPGDSPMTEQELDSIEMWALAATREPWHVEYLGEHGYPQRVANDRAMLVAETFEAGGQPAANAEFIARARTAVPRLIAEVRRLKAAQPVTVVVPQPWELRAAATGGGPCDRCGEPFYTHVCLSCSPDSQTPGPGCVNCRQAGMDQTPCLPSTDPTT